MQKKHKRYNGKTVIGLSEEVVLIGKNNTKKSVVAKIDTGATRSSIDIKLAGQLNIGPIIGTRLVKSAHGNSLRPVAKLKLEIAGIKMVSKFTLADRKHMKYSVLIGQDVLTKNFLIDTSKH